MSQPPCFGIDLGTTTSAIAVVRDGVPHIVQVDGQELLPSVVAYPTLDAPLVGQPALNLLPLQPERTVLSSKRQMGTDHRYPIGEAQVSPVDVATLILGKLADAAEAELGERPRRVVITVPAWFTQAQRSDTRAAGERAGFEVCRIINEPTAAALAHAHGQPAEKLTLVYDFGGGTFDVSLVRQDDVVVEVVASHGDSLLGGDDLDLALVELMLRRLQLSDPALAQAVADSPAARARLRLAVEQAKITLSTYTSAHVRVPFLLELDGVARHFDAPLDRQDVEHLAAPLIQRSLNSVDQVLQDAQVTADQVDELLLVGGTTLLPAVWQVLFDAYGLEGSHAISPRRAVVLGAALQGAIIDGSPTAGILVDVAPYSLSMGLLVDDDEGSQYECVVLTPRNTPLPSRHTEVVATLHPNQATLRLVIFQGAHRDPRDNTVLGHVELDKIPPAPPGHQNRPIRVTFLHSLDGTVTIEVLDELSGRSEKGHVAADGAEVASLREELFKELYRDGHLLERDEEDEDADTFTFGELLEPEHDPDAADDSEAAGLFTAVFEAEERLRREHPAHAQAVLDAARRGQDAIASGDSADLRLAYDEVSDRLFDLGVFL